MLCVKQEGGLEHPSSPSGIINHKQELFFCNEPDSLQRIEIILPSELEVTLLEQGKRSSEARHHS